MIKRLILKLHRMLGSILGLAFVVWFISGFVMLFSGFPHASQEKQFNRLISFSGVDSILDIRHVKYDNICGVTLEKINHTPVYRVDFNDGESRLVDAFTLTEVKSIEPSELDRRIRHTYNTDLFKKKVISDFDAWIPWSHFEKYFPIHKYYLEDPEHAVVYVSEKTGEIVQETTRKQRWLARFGAIPHWFYFKSLRLKKELWAKLIIWISGIGSMMCIFGIILGFLRYRKPKEGLLSFSPYKKKWYKWHHIFGFIFGVFTFTFVFSGMMSLQKVPEYIVPVKNTLDYAEIWKQKHHELSAFKLPFGKLFNDRRLKGVKRIDWHLTAADFPYYFVYTHDLHRPYIVNASQTDTVLICDFSVSDVEKIFAAKFNDKKYSHQLLTASDGYYKKNKSRPLPVIKFVLNDKDKTWLYINPANLKMVKTFNRNTRVRRWLYKGLHSFNFSFLDNMNWLRITLLIILCITGTVISVSGLFLGFKYAKRKLR